ncbi:MAG: HAMP domain-containing sensor histidine kinase [Clostridium sp.]
MKNNSKKIIVSVMIFLILIAVSVGMCCTYDNIEENAKKYEYNIFEDSRFVKNLYNANNSLYYNIKKEGSDDELKPSDLFLNTENIWNENSNNYEYISNKIKRFNEDVYNEERKLDNSLRNLEYYAIEKETGTLDFRSENKIEVLGSEEISNDDIELFEKIYSFYVVIDYDTKGKMDITSIHGADKENLIYDLSGMKSSNMIRSEYSEYLKSEPIKNMRIIYAVPKELQYKDTISSYFDMKESDLYNIASKVFIYLAILLIVVISLVIPYTKSKNLVGFNKISQLPFEINMLLVYLGFVFIMISSIYIIPQSIVGKLDWFFGIDIYGMNISTDVIYVLNTIYWFVCFLSIFIGITLVKHILNMGIMNYINEKCMTYKILKVIINKIKNLLNVDLRDKNTKKIASVLVINLIILIIMCSTWIFGIILAIIYTILLFSKVKKYSNDLSYKYNILLKATNKIAAGNLDVSINEDLGIFEEFKEQIQRIQSGFKKAIAEEVKSQSMKTELISNVSHDLKTPLTSIITYVDLLKNDNFPEEKRKLYLDILDRKSQRLQELIEDLFEMSKATSGNINLNIMDVDIVSLMKQTLLELDDKIDKSGLDFKKNFPKDKVVVELDSQRIFRVFENLILNITKYAMKRTRVYIDIIDRGKTVDIILKNMTEEEISFNVNDIVERFVRGDKARNTDGSGLGLAIAKSFVELQGGKFNIDIDGDLFKVTMIFDKKESNIKI